KSLHRRENSQKVTEEYERLGKELENLRVDFDIIDDDVFCLSQGLDEGIIKLSNACYKRIIVPKHAYLPQSTKETLERFSAGGGTVCYSTSKISRIMPEIGEKKIRLMQRTAENGEIYILFNEEVLPMTFSLPKFDKKVYLANLEDGKLYLKNSGKMSLASGETAVIFVTDEELPAEKEAAESDEYIVLDKFKFSKKTRSVLKKTGCEETVLFEEFEDAELGDWSEKVGRDFSGSCVYKTQFSLSKIPDENALLDLGNVYYTAEVSVNGKFIGRKLASPYKFVLPKEFLKKNNTLEITVTNTIANQYVHTGIFDGYTPAQLSPYYEKERKFMMESLQSGLFGPVKVLFNE
ncbi:MAG: hypothetical protein IJS17_02905, partial [Clostridia bacterium]|nr:hypothetical protein [Clostridia bacterium]